MFRSRPSDRERGAAAVEFALVAPLLFTLLFATVEIGRGWTAQVSLTSAVHDGARAVATGTGDATAAVLAAAGGLDASRISVTAPATCSTGETVTVAATYLFQASLPLVGQLDRTLSATGVMRCSR